MENETLTVDAVAFEVEAVNLDEIEAMEESFAASSDSK
jgi:hypothetical protein